MFYDFSARSYIVFEIYPLVRLVWSAQNGVAFSSRLNVLSISHATAKGAGAELRRLVSDSSLEKLVLKDIATGTF
jgi:hypothetical protein